MQMMFFYEIYCKIDSLVPYRLPGIQWGVTYFEQLKYVFQP
jgi:hypothetical protein